MIAALPRLVLAMALWRAGRQRPLLLPIWIGLALLAPWGMALFALAGPAAMLWRRFPTALAKSGARDQVRRAVPGLLTDLAMAAAAGQPLHAALRYAGLWAQDPLGPALRSFQDRVQEGHSVAAALDGLRLSLRTPETDRLVALLSRDAQLGLPLSDSIARYRRSALGDVRKELRRSAAYLPYVFTTLAGIVLLEGVGLVAIPWLMSLWRSI
jgi:Flp pilus assembly protein TadB